MDILDLSRIFFALIAVLGMIGLCAMIAKKAGLVSGAVGLAKKRRLAIVETLPLDARRRAAIIRCDGREHLVILGQASETLVEANIPALLERGIADAAPPATNSEPIATPNFRVAMAKLKEFARNPYLRRIKDEQKAA
jgi:flagellar protein FliO/FliZ